MNASADKSPFPKGPGWPTWRLSARLLLMTGAVALAVSACSGSVSPGGSSSGDPAKPNDGKSPTPGNNNNNNPGSPPTSGNMNPSDPPSGPPAAPAPAGVRASAAPLRRLNVDQYKNTIQDLLGAGDLVIDGALPPDEAISEERFISNVARPVQGSDVDKYADLAEAIARKATTALPALLGCDPAGANEASCVNSFIASFGKRAFRRPLSPAEIDRARTVFMTGRNGADVANGVRLMVQAFLQAPSFLYLFESSSPGNPGDIVALDSWAMASRLSYFFLNSMPDADLFGAAEGGKLATADDVAKQATRLTTTPRFREMVSNFHAQWLEINELKGADKDAKAFPAWNDALRAAMLEEPRRFVEYVMKDGDGRLDTLLTAPFSVISGPLYELYGVKNPGGAAATGWTKVDLDPAQRAGLFTQPGIMSALAKEDRTSFIRRGKLVRSGLFCTPVPDPPPGIDASEAMIPATADARTRAAAHRDKPECASCHALFDPLGFAFENYDAIGRYRVMDNGKPVDAKTDIAFSKNLDGPVANAVDMLKKLAGDDEVRSCVAKQWMRFALGRDDTPDDATSLDEAMNGFKAGNWKLSDLLLAVARSDSFRYQKVKP
jgi:hypothetical protein